jgi:ABC-type nitrate/sulfonate/bicarbonate transport system substrate-binding protein
MPMKIFARSPARWLARLGTLLRLGLHAATSAVGVLLFVTALGCSRKQAPAEKMAGASGFETLKLRYQGFSGMVTFPELAEDLGYLAPMRLEYVGNTISGPQDIQTVVTHDTDIGGAFNGAILKLIAAQAPIQAVVGYYGVDQETWGGFYVLDGSPIHSARDLIGKKVAMNTLGAHYEFVLREFLTRHGLSKDEIAQVTMVVVPPLSGEQALRQGQVEVTSFQGILRDKALERGGIRKLFSDYELFGPFTAGSYVMARDFLKKNPRAARHFVEATARAIEWARQEPRETVIARFESIIKARGRGEDTSLVKYWRTSGVAGQGGLLRDQEFEMWIDWLARDGQIGRGRLKPTDIYTNELNPFFKTAS